MRSWRVPLLVLVLVALAIAIVASASSAAPDPDPPGANTPPFAPDVNLGVKKNTPQTFSPAVFDEDGDPLTITSATPSADHGTVNVLRGTVQRASYLGTGVEYQVKVGDSDVVLRATGPTSPRMRVGESVGLRIDADACIPLLDSTG
jgi:hypothetical protein